MAKYPCDTQNGTLPTIALPPDVTPSGGDSKHRKIFVGAKELIPRWKVPTGGLKLRWFVAEQTFKSKDDATYAAAAFQKATDEWGKIGFGVMFETTTNEAASHFRLCHGDSVNKKTKDSDDSYQTLAKAFFPHIQSTTDVWVLPRAFDKDQKPNMYNTFLHEVGHVLGLRHEFTGLRMFLEQLGSKSVQIGTSNEKSVMSYNLPPVMQSTDIDGIKKFYALEENHDIDGIKVTDYAPVLRVKNGPLLGNQ